MTYSLNLRKLILFALTIGISHFTYGQKLGMNDIFEMYSLDSITLKKSCADRNFSLVHISEDNWIFSYNFRSNNDEKVSFSKTFPKDTAANKFANYQFYSYKDYRELKKEIKRIGFTFERTLSNDYGSVSYTKDFYRNDVYEIMLSEEKRNGALHSCSLMLYKISPSSHHQK